MVKNFPDHHSSKWITITSNGQIKRPQHSRNPRKRVVVLVFGGRGSGWAVSRAPFNPPGRRCRLSKSKKKNAQPMAQNIQQPVIARNQTHHREALIHCPQATLLVSFSVCRIPGFKILSTSLLAIPPLQHFLLFLLFCCLSNQEMECKDVKGKRG